MTSRRTAAFAAVVLVAATLLVGIPGPAAAEPVDQAAAGRGRWSVASVGGDRYQVSWRSPDRLPTTSDRPTIVAPAGVTVATPTVAADGRTVRAVVRSTTGAPDPRRLDVLLSGDRLDHVGRDRSPAASAAALRRAGTSAFPPLATDPGAAGPYPVVISDYTRPSVRIAGMSEPIEMVGHVVEPARSAATGPRPLVFFLHGRHEVCYLVGFGQPNGDWPCRGTMREIPSHLGYDYIQRRLASQGYTTVSVRVNGINAQDYALDDGGAGARATIVQRHLAFWTTAAARHRTDLRRTILVGHSRGGEGVNRAAIRIPLSAPYRIVGQVLVAPTNFADQTAPYVPTVTMLPYCDGDVFDLQGQRFTDISRDIDRADPSLKSSVMVLGANHNYFNTEWTPGLSAAPSGDDWFGEDNAPCGRKTPDRLSAADQRRVGRTYIAGAVRLFAGGDQAVLPMFDGSRVSVPSAGRATVLSHALGGGRDVRRASVDTALALPRGARTEFCTGSVDFEYRPGLCGAPIDDLVSPHWQYRTNPVPTRKWFSLSWTARDQTGGLLLNKPLDLRGRTLDLRTVVDPRLGAVRLRVRLTDAGGASATLNPVGGTLIRPLPSVPGADKIWAQNVRVDPSRTGLDLARITRVDLVGASPDGRVWVADVAAGGSRLAAVPAVRLPAVSLGEARVREGNRPGWVTAEVPFRLSAPMPKPGRLLAVTVDAETAGTQRRFSVDLAPGQTTGSIPVGYEADTRDDRDETLTFAVAWATSNVMTDDYLGSLTVLDDDPTPAVTVRPLAGTVTEGTRAQWRLTLAAPVDYPVVAVGAVVRGPGARLDGRDVPLSWLTDHASLPDRSKPLDQLGAYVVGEIEPGATTAVLSIPTLNDTRKEGRESVTLRVEVQGLLITRTIYVRASD